MKKPEQRLSTRRSARGIPPQSILSSISRQINRRLGIILSIALLSTALTVLLAPATVTYAADGDLDPTFDTDGKVTTAVSNNAKAKAMVIQSDGKILVGGTDTDDFVIMRYNPDGSLDTSFGVNGQVTTDFGSSERIKGLAIDTNGKIVAAGTSGNDFALARYNSDGSLDTSFSTDGKVTTDFNNLGGNYATAEGTGVAIDPNGKIVVVGYVQNGSEFNDFAVARYNPDGSLDTSFNNGGGLPPGQAGIVTTSVQVQEEDQAYGVAIQPDGKILVVGDTKGAPGIFVLLRYNSDGSLDTTFSTDGKAYAVSTKVATGFDVALQPDGKIVVIGAKSVTDPTSNNCVDSGGKYCEYKDFWVARYNPDGSPDTGFGVNGEVSTPINPRGNHDQGRSIAVQTDGKIVAAGHADMSIHTFSGEDENYTRTDDFALARYNNDGSLDTSFSTDGKTTTDFDNDSNDEACAVAIQTDGKIVAAGNSNDDFAVARYSGKIAEKDNTTTTLTSSPNPSTPSQEVTFTATVSASSGTPTGSVTFYDGATELGSAPLVNGVATLKTSQLSEGAHSLSAIYGGDSTYSTSLAQHTHTVEQADGLTNKYYLPVVLK